MESHIEIRWQDGLRFEAEDRDGHTIFIDSAPEHGGGSAFRPTDLLLVALAGCTGMDVISILKKKRQEVTGFQVVVRGEKAKEHPKKFLRLEIEYVVRGKGVSPQAVERAIELSTTKYCPVHAQLEDTAEIDHHYRIEEE